MTSHTSKGVPYVTGTDTLVDYPAVSLELAQRIQDAASVSYTEQVSAISVAVASSTEANAVPLVNPVVFTAGGTEWWWVEFFAPAIACNPTGACDLWLFDNGASLGRLTQVYFGSAGGMAPVRVKRVYRPTAGDHSVIVKASNAFAAATMQAGVGGAGQWVPAWIQASRAII